MTYNKVKKQNHNMLSNGALNNWTQILLNSILPQKTMPLRFNLFGSSVTSNQNVIFVYFQCVNPAIVICKAWLWTANCGWCNKQWLSKPRLSWCLNSITTRKLMLTLSPPVAFILLCVEGIGNDFEGLKKELLSSQQSASLVSG